MLGYEDKGLRREAMAGFETFCEWMDVEESDVEVLKDQLELVNELKPFKFELNPIHVTEKKKVERKSTFSRQRSRGQSAKKRKRYKIIRKDTVISVAEQVSETAKFLHSSIVDRELLARPTIVSDTRKESALKYVGMWGSRKVNINSAPRQVLEAAFSFGGDATRIADEIIFRRRTKPFEDIDELKESLFGYSDSIRKCEPYIMTESRFFTIRVTAVSGSAKTSAVIAVMKDEIQTDAKDATKKDVKIHRIGVIPG